MWGTGLAFAAIQLAQPARKKPSGTICQRGYWIRWVLEIWGKVEAGNLVARLAAALKFVAALLPDVSGSADAETKATCLVAVAVVLPDLKLAARTAVLLTTSTTRVSLVFRSAFACLTPSTTAALLSLLTVVIQFSSLWK